MINDEKPGPAAVSEPAPTVSVVICAYTEDRLADLTAAVESIRSQEFPALETLLVIDYNDALLAHARAAFPDVRVLANVHAKGLSGARNTGVDNAAGEILAFLDDDARARPDWLTHLIAPYAEPDVVGVGGTVTAAWPDRRPGWFPPEFDWVVGCSYVGLPTTVSEVRNPIGAAMSFRRAVVPKVGGFADGIGRVGATPLGCEETEFYIRVRQAMPGSRVLYVPEAIVHHHVSSARASVAYFRRRCYAEGISKAIVTDSVGASDALKAERAYVRRVLPRAVARGARRRADWPRSAAILAGVGITAAGYARGLYALRSGAIASVGGSTQALAGAQSPS